MDSLDEFQRSALAYKELVDNHVRYRIEFFSAKPVTVALGSEKTAETIRMAGNTVNIMEIIFTPDEFKHLSSVHKLKDIDDLSKPLYDKAVNISGHGKKFDMNNIRRSNYFFDDIDKSQNLETKDMTDEEFQETIEKTTDKYFLSKLLGRLDSLEHLYDTLAQSGLTEIADSARPLELKMYVWNRQTSRYDRPHGSEIKANFLIEIKNPDNPDKPYTDFFIVRAKDGTYRGMSVFPSEVSYHSDKYIEVASLTMLSVETFKSGKSISKVLADENVIEDCRQREENHNRNVANEIQQDPNKKIREKFFSKLGNHRSQFIKKDSRLNTKNYYKMIEVDLLSYNFSEDDLKKLQSSIKQSLNVSNTSEKKNACIAYEIATIDIIIELKNKLDKLEHLLQQEDFPVDAYVKKLDEVSAYLCSHDAGRNLMLKVAELIERQKENCNDDLTAGYIDCTVQEIRETAEQKPEKSFGQFGSAYGQTSAKPGNNMMQFRFDNSLSDIQANTLALSASDMFRNALRSLAERFETFMQNIVVKIQETFTMALSKPYSDVSEKPEQKSAPEPDTQENLSEPEMKSEPAEPAPETEIADDEYIIRDVYSIFADDSIGTQGYESYVMIVPADKLDFQIPFTYETEPQAEIQQTEQDMTEEKAMPSEFIKKQVKKQAEYDDF